MRSLRKAIVLPRPGRSGRFDAALAFSSQSAHRPRSTIFHLFCNSAALDSMPQFQYVLSETETKFFR
jgi:hypothetical protein